MTASGMFSAGISKRHLRRRLLARLIKPARATAGKRALPLTYSLHESLDGIAAEWQAFEADARRSVFQDRRRLWHWQREIGNRIGAKPVIVVGRLDEGGIGLLLPLMLTRRGGLTRLGFLGGEMSDYNAPLVSPQLAVRPGALAADWPRIAATLHRAGCRYDVLDLVKMPESVGGTRNPLLDLQTSENPSAAFATALGTDWEAFHASKRSASTRKRERRHLKKLAEAGEVRFVEPATPEARRETLDLLLAQKADALQRSGFGQFFDHTGRREFLRALVTTPGDTVHVSRLDVGDRMVAASVGLIQGGCYHLVLSSYDSGPLSKFGPGRAHLHRLMQWAIEHGLGIFDFTIGDEPYKRDWCEIEIKLHDHVSGASALGQAYALALRGQRLVKRTIKQNTHLWRLAQAVRARLRGGPKKQAEPAKAEE